MDFVIRYCGGVSEACERFQQLRFRPRDAFGVGKWGCNWGWFSDAGFCGRRMRCTFDADVMLDDAQTASGEPEHFTLCDPVDGQVIDPRQELAIYVRRPPPIENCHGNVRGKVAEPQQPAEILG